MASINSIIFISSLILILFASISPHTHGIQLNGLVIPDVVRFQGVVACSPSGNPSPNGPFVPAVGVLVTGVCNGASGSLGTVLTDTSGAYSGILSVVDGVLFDQGQCYIQIQLPVTGATCTVFPPTGTLRAVGNLVFQGILSGRLTDVFQAGPFHYVH